jgi:hypothetical protein
MSNYILFVSSLREEESDPLSSQSSRFHCLNPTGLLRRKLLLFDTQFSPRNDSKFLFEGKNRFMNFRPTPTSSLFVIDFKVKRRVKKIAGS